jgi:hypothetical protein
VDDRVTTRRRCLAASLLAAAAVLLLAGGCWSGSASSPAYPDVTPFPPELEARLHEIRDDSSVVRELPVHRGVEEGILSREALAEDLEEDPFYFSEDEEQDAEAFQVGWRLLGMIGPDDDLEELAGESHSEGIVGLYIPDDDQLLLIDEPVGGIEGQDELTVAHEYVHSFQDVAFDWDTLYDLLANEDEDSETEYYRTIDCVSEGDAMAFEPLYGDAVYGQDWYEEQFTDDALGEFEPAGDLPPALARELDFNYVECADFVAAIQEQGGWEAVDALYENPPATTEQVLHLNKYATHEMPHSSAPAELGVALEGLKRVSRTVFGEFDTYNYLMTVFNDDAQARLAAGGWGSGWLTVYTGNSPDDTTEPPSLAHLYLDWDGQADFDQFLKLYGDWLRAMGGASWSSAGPAGPVRWTADGNYGLMTWDPEKLSVDIVIATRAKDREDAAREL